eukprot:7446778-Prorocentrum_lima.AAC.1
MYGLEAVHLTRPLLSLLDTFRNRGYRNILHMVTTFVDRSQTNAKLHSRADPRRTAVFREGYHLRQRPHR